MGDFDIKQGTDEWARDRNIKTTCGKHHKEYDPHIGCPECLSEQRLDKQKRLRQAFEIIERM